MIKAIRNNRGDGYIDVVVGMLVMMMVIVLALNVFSFLSIKQNMDHYAKEMIATATTYGRTIIEVDARQSQLTAETGLNPKISWRTTYYNWAAEIVQYGEPITVTLTYNTYVMGFGVFKIPITLTTKYSGISMKYWK